MNIGPIKDGVENGFLNKHYGSINSIAFLIDSTCNNQVFFYSSMKSNIILQKYGHLELALYTSNYVKPPYYPMMPIYSIGDITEYTGHAIATSLGTLEYLLNTRIKNKYFYVYNMAEILYIHENFLNTIKQSNVKIFTRNDDYAKILERNFGMTIESTRVPDFNIEKILNITGIKL